MQAITKDYTVLKTYCDKANIYITELAEMTGINYNTLIKIVKGETKAGKRTRRALDKFMDIHDKAIRTVLSNKKSA